MLALLIAVFVTAADQVTKYIIRTEYVLGESRTVIPGFMDLTYLRNTGAAWGMLGGQNAFLIIFSVVMLSLMVIFRKAFLSNTLDHRIALGLMAGGILGNLLDRLRLGWVTDFLDLYIKEWHWPAFNIADMAICMGVGIYLITSTWQVKHPQGHEQSGWVLAGPTAVGKTAVAHRIAADRGRVILSADAMLVYRGMDIGTAKPTAAERAEVKYLGLDLADPSETFSTGAWLENVRPRLPDAPVLVAGGTGLYIRALLQGLDAETLANPALRAELEALAAGKGLSALRQKLLDEHPEWYASLKDRENPRRLIRAYELAHSGAPAPKSAPRPVRITGLRMERDALAKRIAQRVDFMFKNGLMEEVRVLREKYPRLSETAAHAIGYAEAAAVLAGKIRLEEAKEQTALRTRQLAKRQMTWFRHQAEVEWINVKPGMNTAEVAGQVCAAWEQEGPVRLHV